MIIDWTHIAEEYPGLWVALKDDEQTVVASGKTVQEAVDKSKARGMPDPLLFRVPTKVIPYVGGCTLV